jgi:hypothetical protein
VLKAVFTAVEDFPDMCRTVTDLASRLRSRRGKPEEADSARAFLSWLLEDNYIFQGVVRYRVGADSLPDRIPESASGVFTDPELLPGGVPGPDRRGRGASSSDNDHRIVDVDYCHNAESIYHLEPIDDVVVRWRAGRQAGGSHAAGGPLRQGRLHPEDGRDSAAQEKMDWLLVNSGTAPKSYAYREIRALFNRIPPASCSTRTCRPSRRSSTASST